ncbi:MAG: Asp23/Gls24 family envelope stress response protein [Oscillospiraceae bacterium]|jgi:uncharacterized alkaline shock family protein YloU|nr:Asp23/Gls24 family envelope stress response protein [Oscillospiraceae bacterium]
MLKQKTPLGEIIITGEVFTTLAGAAASNCFGVRGMAYRSVSDGLVHLLKREVVGKGVHISYSVDPDNGNSISVELHIVAKTGVNLPVICSAIIEDVAYKLNRDTGTKVDAVDVYIDSVMID